MAKANADAPRAAASTGSSGSCIAFSCKKSANKAEFCEEHFRWYKLGLLNKTGEKARDFDKKLQQVRNLIDSPFI